MNSEDFAKLTWKNCGQCSPDSLDECKKCWDEWVGPNEEDYTALRVGSPIWYVSFENGMIETGSIATIYFKDGRVDTFSVDFDVESFDEFLGTGLGTHFFMSEAAANDALVKGKSPES